MAKAKRKNLFFGITARALMLMAAGLLVVSYISFFFNPAKAWIMTIFGLLFLPLLLLNIGLLFWAVYRRSKTVLIPLVVIAPALLLSKGFIQLKGPEEYTGSERITRILSYNVGRFRAASDGLKNAPAAEVRDSIISFASKEDADIICFQEYYTKNIKQMEEYLGRHFKGYSLSYYMRTTGHGYSGNVTLTRPQVRAKGKISFEESANLALWSDVNINGETIRIHNCHLESYNISLSRIATTISGDNYKEMFHDTESKMRNSIIKRPKQVDKILSNIDNSPSAAIVVGDFNDTPISYTYRRLMKNRKDSFVEAGKGEGSTYRFLRPLLRIDYILFPDRYRAVSHRILKDRKYSDHFPVEAEIIKER